MQTVSGLAAPVPGTSQAGVSCWKLWRAARDVPGTGTLSIGVVSHLLYTLRPVCEVKRGNPPGQLDASPAYPARDRISLSNGADGRAGPAVAEKTEGLGKLSQTLSCCVRVCFHPSLLKYDCLFQGRF